MTEHELPLEGGNLNPGVVRVGDTVRRSAGSWTPAVHDLLRHLADHSYPAPRPLGIDDEGREILTFIPGYCVHPNNLAALDTDAAMRRVGKLIAEYHRAQAGYVSPLDATWRSEGRVPIAAPITTGLVDQENSAFSSLSPTLRAQISQQTNSPAAVKRRIE